MTTLLEFMRQKALEAEAVARAPPPLAPSAASAPVARAAASSRPAAVVAKRARAPPAAAAAPVRAPPPRPEGLALLLYIVFVSPADCAALLLAVSKLAGDKPEKATIILDFEADGLHVRQLHPSHVILAELHMHRALFLEYDAPSPACSVRLRCDDVTNTFSSLENEASLTIFLADPSAVAHRDSVFVRTYTDAHANVTYALGAIDASVNDAEVIESPHRERPYADVFTLATKTLLKYVTTAKKQGATTLELILEADAVRLRAQRNTRTEHGSMNALVPVAVLRHGPPAAPAPAAPADAYKPVAVLDVEYMATVLGAVAPAMAEVRCHMGLQDPVWFAFSREHVTLDCLVCQQVLDEDEQEA